MYSMLLHFFPFGHRPLRFIVSHISWPGLPGFWADSTLAVFAGITFGCVQLSDHHLGGNQWRVQTHWSRWSLAKMGREEIKTKHELRQDEPSIEVSCKFFFLSQSYFIYSTRHPICLSVWMGVFSRILVACLLLKSRKFMNLQVENLQDLYWKKCILQTIFETLQCYSFFAYLRP